MRLKAVGVLSAPEVAIACGAFPIDVSHGLESHDWGRFGREELLSTLNAICDGFLIAPGEATACGFTKEELEILLKGKKHVETPEELTKWVTSCMNHARGVKGAKLENMRKLHSVLIESPVGLTRLELASQLSLSPAYLSYLLTLLKDEGLIERVSGGKWQKK